MISGGGLGLRNYTVVDRVGCTRVLICVHTLEEAMADVAQSRIPGKPHTMGRYP